MSEKEITANKETESKAITTFNANDYEALNPASIENFKEAMEINLEGEDISIRSIFTSISMPSGGSTMFSYETVEGEVSTKEIVGIVVHIQPERALFLGEFGESKYPECVSSDGKVGYGNPGGDCLTCVENQFGPNNSPKPCKESKSTYILIKGEHLPVVLRITPGSFKALKNYRIGLLQKGLNLHSVETIFSLEKVKNAQGIAFAKLVIRPGNRILDKNTIDNIKKMKEGMLPFITRTDFVSEPTIKTEAEAEFV